MNTAIISNVIHYGVSLSSCKYSLSGGMNYYFPQDIMDTEFYYW